MISKTEAEKNTYVIQEREKYGVGGIPAGHKLFGFGALQVPGIPIEDPLFIVIHGPQGTNLYRNYRPKLTLCIGTTKKLLEALVNYENIDEGGYGWIDYELNGKGRINFVACGDVIDHLEYKSEGETYKNVKIPVSIPIRSFLHRHDSNSDQSKRRDPINYPIYYVTA